MEHLRVLVRGDTTRPGVVATLRASTRGVLHCLPQKLSGAAFAALLLNTSPVRADGGNGGIGQTLIPLFGTGTAGFGAEGAIGPSAQNYGSAGGMVCGAG
ncbi:MAG TPA: hypothetical protein VIQ05_11790, partial [Tardiphaga sp.]